jgi:Protein of unknown function (DUF3071)
MQDLQLIGVHEDGEHLLLSGPGDKRFRMPVDEALRAAIRRDRPRLGQLQLEGDDELRPRDVQALIRAGASADEAASRAGWSVEKVHRYEGPILAEREHVAGLAQQARLRSRSHGANSGTPTLSVRVTERLKERDVEVTDASWDSWRTEGHPWTVVLTFAAGGRQRQASWTYDLADRTVSAIDDEARWLSEEVQEARGPIPAPRQQHPASGRRTTVYDVEAEGGLRPATHEERQEDPLDLMTAMRKRSTARGRRKPAGRAAPAAAQPAAGVDSAENDRPDQEAHLTHLEERHLEQRLPEQHHAEQHHAEQHHAEQHHAEQQGDSDLAATSPDRVRPAVTLGEATGEDDFRDDSAPKTSEMPSSRSRGEHADGGYRESAAEDGAGKDGASKDSASDDSAPEPIEKPVRQGRSKPQPKKRARDTARKTGRPSVPAWDEIMFGSRSGVDRSSS